jgi:hypothetical protein
MYDVKLENASLTQRKIYISTENGAQVINFSLAAPTSRRQQASENWLNSAKFYNRFLEPVKENANLTQIETADNEITVEASIPCTSY